MRLRIAGVTLAGVLALPAAASADATVQAVDGTAANGGVNQWSPSAPTVKVGEKVTWTFAGTTLNHNLKSDAGAWTLATPIAVAGPDATYTFTAPGTYTFFCELHRSTMTGSVTVTDATGA